MFSSWLKFPFTILVHSSDEFWNFNKNWGKNMDWTNKLAILTGWKVHIWVDGNLTSILTRSSYFAKETWLQYCN
jgi:hypothetical protein